MKKKKCASKEITGAYYFGVVLILIPLKTLAACGTLHLEQYILNSEIHATCNLDSNKNILIEAQGKILVTRTQNDNQIRNFFGLTVGSLSVSEPAVHAGTIINHGEIKTYGAVRHPNGALLVGRSRGIAVMNNSSIQGLVNTGVVSGLGHGLEFGRGGLSGSSSLIPQSVVVPEPLINALIARGEYSIINAGTIEAMGDGFPDANGFVGTKNNTGLVVAQGSRLEGGIFNSGAISGTYIGLTISDSWVGGALLNETGGVIYGRDNGVLINATDPAKQGVLSGLLINKGSIRAGDLRGIALEVKDGVLSEGIENSGGVQGTNEGIYISGAHSSVGKIINTGTILGGNGKDAIRNEGLIVGGVENRGQIFGNVSLGSADLTLAGATASIQGNTTAKNVTVALQADASAFQSGGRLAASAGLGFQQGVTTVAHAWQGHSVWVDAAPGTAAAVVLAPNGVLSAASSTQPLQIGGSGGDSRITVQNGARLLAGSGRMVIGAGGALQIGSAPNDHAQSLQATAWSELSNVTRIDLQAPSAMLQLNFAATPGHALHVDAGLSGAGQLRQQAGHTVLTADNTHSGGTRIDSGTLQVGDGGRSGSLGSGAIHNDGVLRVNRSDTLGLAQTIQGSGRLEKQGTGTLTLLGANSYSGGTVLKAGRVEVGNDQALGSGTLSMDDGTALGFVADGVTIRNALVMTGRNDPVLDTQGYDATYAGAIAGAGFLSKQGRGSLTLSSTANTYTGATVVEAGRLRAGTQLVVQGSWQGGGTVYLRTVLGGDGALSDRVVLDGPAATVAGSTRLQIHDVAQGRSAALTQGDGIMVVQGLRGAETGAQATSPAFVLDHPLGYLPVGPFEYRLRAGDAHGAGNNWYLRNATYTQVVSAADGTVRYVPKTAYRVEMPLLAAAPAQLRFADMELLGSFHQRTGSAWPDKVGTGWARWLRAAPSLRQQGELEPRSQGHWQGFQAGVALYASPRAQAGVYVGQLDGDSAVQGFASGEQGKPVGQQHGRNRYVGMYGSLRAASGAYLDAVLQRAQYRMDWRVHEGISVGQPLQARGHGWQASLEAGVPLHAWHWGPSTWHWEPQVQLVYSQMRLGGVMVPQASLQYATAPHWTLRWGARMEGQWQGRQGVWKPYARLNWYQTSSRSDVLRAGDGPQRIDMHTPTRSGSAEVAAGFTWQLIPRASVYGEVGRRWARSGDARTGSGTQASMGVQWTW